MARRPRFGDAVYAGIKREVNQRHPMGDPRACRELRRAVVASLAGALREEEHSRAAQTRQQPIAYRAEQPDL